LIHHSFAFYGFSFFGLILLRYFILAGGIYWLMRRGFKSANPGAIKPPAIKEDIKLSILSSVIFSLGAASIMVAYNSGITRLYLDIHQYPLWYLAVSYLLVIVLQDAYFYFLHRLFHHPALFFWLHRGHHRSIDPTPWTSFAFDSLESVAHLVFLVAIVFILPIHFVTMIAVLMTMTIWSVMNHLGLKWLPEKFPHHWCGKWFIGPAHHTTHHHQYRYHYGLYFTFWDRQLGTESPKYDQELTDSMP
jgi:Delta7-sterol 5-desaturase